MWAFTSQYVTFRRCAVFPTLWHGNSWCGNPYPFNAGFMLYQSRNCTIENCFIHPHPNPQAHITAYGISLNSDEQATLNNYGGICSFGIYFNNENPDVWVGYHTIAGNFVANARRKANGSPMANPTGDPRADCDFWNSWTADLAGGSGYHWTADSAAVQDVTWVDNVAYHGSGLGIARSGGSPSSNVRHVVRRLTAFDNGDGCAPQTGGTAADTTSSYLSMFTSVESNCKIERVYGGSPYTGEGARLKYRYVDGTVTATPLWPFPINAKVLTQVGFDVTAYVTAANADATYGGFMDR
jgi:hypothetical protein